MELEEIRAKVESQMDRDLVVVEAERQLEAWSIWARESGRATEYAIVLSPRRDHRLTAQGREKRVFQEIAGQVPPLVAAVDKSVARLPERLRRIVGANYFMDANIGRKARAIGMKRARFSQLLEAAKYSVWVGVRIRLGKTGAHV